MSSKNLTVDLSPRTDSSGKVFYVGKIEFPGVIDCSKGVTFLVFTSEEGGEQLQIAKMDKKDRDEE